MQIRQERIKRGWTEREVAERLGITKGALHNIETGHRKPSYDVLVKLENLFHMNHRKLFGTATPDKETTSSG